MGWLDNCFSDLPDPRTGNAKRHDLLEVLTIALVAAICGAETCVDFADFARDCEPLFRDFLKLENGLPSHDTFSRLFRLLDPAAFCACFGRFLEHLGASGPGVLAIDGKTLRRSFDRAAAASPLHVVTAFARDSRLVLGPGCCAGGRQRASAEWLLRLTGARGGDSRSVARTPPKLSRKQGNPGRRARSDFIQRPAPSTGADHENRRVRIARFLAMNSSEVTSSRMTASRLSSWHFLSIAASVSGDRSSRSSYPLTTSSLLTNSSSSKPNPRPRKRCSIGSFGWRISARFLSKA